MSDLSLAFRSLVKSPRFAFLAVLILAVGIAGNTVVFTLVSGLFIRPLPFPNPERLVDIDETAPKWGLKYTGLNYDDFEAWRSQNKTFDSMAHWRGGSSSFAMGERNELLAGQSVTHDIAEVFGIQPVLGRMFTAEDEFRGTPTVALIAHHIWRDWFNSDPAVLGKTVTIDSQVCEIIGVLPESAVFPSRAAFWQPFGSKPKNYAGLAIGRLKPGVSIEQASADLLRIHKALISQAKSNENTSPIIQPVLLRYIGDGKGIAIVLQAAVGVLLLIACANIAGLMLARTLGRMPELGLRSALGASRWRIVRQLLAESFVLTVGGTLLGVFLGRWLLSGVLASVISELPSWITLSVDFRFVLFITGISALSAVIAGLIPARHVLRRIDLRSVMGSGAQQSTVSGNRLLSLRSLVAGEIALSLVLLLVASLLGRAFLRVQNTDPGIRPEKVLTYGIMLPKAKYKDKTSRIAFFREHLERVRALPEVESVSASTVLPFSGQHVGNFFEPEGGLKGGPDAKAPVVLTRTSFPGYFETMGIMMKEGRGFNEQDLRDVAVVNETLARLFWPDGNAVGKRLRTPGGKGNWIEVIGVAHDVRHYGLEGEVRPGIYIPFYASPEPSIGIIVRTKGDPVSLPPSLREILKQQDSTLPMIGLSSMEEKIKQTLFLRRMYSGMTTTFALIAVVMAMTGLYGLVSYVVGQRTREFGIRLALGAQIRDLTRLVLREGLILAGIGGVLGLAGGILASFTISGLMAGVSPFDPLVLGTTLLLLCGIVLLSCLSPAHRAAKINPMEALRAE